MKVLNQEYTDDLTPEEEALIVREHEERMQREGQHRSRMALYFILVAAAISITFFLVFFLFIKRYT